MYLPQFVFFFFLIFLSSVQALIFRKNKKKHMFKISSMRNHWVLPIMILSASHSVLHMLFHYNTWSLKWNFPFYIVYVTVRILTKRNMISSFNYFKFSILVITVWVWILGNKDVLAFSANIIKARLKETLKSRDHLSFGSMIHDC